MADQVSSRTADQTILTLFVDRWSPRAFSGEALDEGALERFFEAARWAPSSNNSQPWKFIYSIKGTLAFNRVLSVVNERNRRWAKNASALILLLSQKTSGASQKEALARHHSFDAGAAWMSFALEAQRSGWSTHAIAGFEEEAARREFEIPKNHQIEIVIAVGRKTSAAQLPEDLQPREAPNSRKKVDEFVSDGEFASSWR